MEAMDIGNLSQLTDVGRNESNEWRQYEEKHMKINSVARNSMKASIEDSVQKVLEILEKEDGRTFEEKKSEAIQYLQTRKDTTLAEKLLDIATEDEIGKQRKLQFWKQGEIIQVTDDIILRDVKESDRSSFFKLQQQYSIIKSMLKDDAYLALLWEEHISCKTLMCTIENNGIYVGYCGIKNLACEKWEIAIEILEEWTNQGIGYAAVKALVNEIKKRVNVTEFRVRIDPENDASQKLFEKLGAVPDGISEFMLHQKEDIERCENDNLDSVDNKLIETAKKFGVEPRRLLSHVLEYKLTI